MNKVIVELRDLRNFDANTKSLIKMRKAKLGMSAILRAAKKDDYLSLLSDSIPEIDPVRHFWPKIDQFLPWLR